MATDLKNARCNTPEDFPKAMKESKVTFPEFGAVLTTKSWLYHMDSPRTITIQVGLRLVVNFACADAVRVVVSNRTIVPHLETIKDVTKLVKIAVKSKMYSGGTSMEGFQSRAAYYYLFFSLVHHSRSFF